MIKIFCFICVFCHSSVSLLISSKWKIRLSQNVSIPIHFTIQKFYGWSFTNRSTEPRNHCKLMWSIRTCFVEHYRFGYDLLSFRVIFGLWLNRILVSTVSSTIHIGFSFHLQRTIFISDEKNYCMKFMNYWWETTAKEKRAKTPKALYRLRHWMWSVCFATFQLLERITNSILFFFFFFLQAHLLVACIHSRFLSSSSIYS